KCKYCGFYIRCAKISLIMKCKVKNMFKIAQYKCPTCYNDLKFNNEAEYEYFICHSCDFACDHVLTNDSYIPDIIISNKEIDADNINNELLNRILQFKNKLLKNQLKI
ncbi:MAG: hypothetical protein MJB14_10625, partial [Spirochaetes bacterium]|nr:hypothetical protein [Spirochaetota bacterium]